METAMAMSRTICFYRETVMAMSRTLCFHREIAMAMSQTNVFHMNIVIQLAQAGARPGAMPARRARTHAFVVARPGLQGTGCREIGRYLL